MMWIKSVILSVFFVNISSYELKSFQSPADILHQKMAELLELCFTNVSNPIAVTPNLVDTIYKNVPSTFVAPIIILDDDFVSKDVQLFLPTYPTFVISVPGVSELSELVKKIKSSPMWSIHSKFIVIGDSEESCVDAFPILKQLWEFELLSSVVVCPESKNVSLYTYNPYTNRAPDPWRKVEGADDPDGRWTLFKTPFINHHLLCNGLTFDKTKFMDGYPLKVISRGHYEKFFNHDIIPYLNMTANIRYDDLAKDSLVNGTADIWNELTIVTRYSESIDIVPSVMAGHKCVIVTQKRTFLATIYDIPLPFDFYTGIAMIVAILMILLLIHLNHEYQIAPAIRDVWLLLLRMGMETPLDRLSLKLTFLVGFTFIFYYSPNIEAGIFAVLARPPSVNVESLKDLYEHNYHIYYPFTYTEIILGAGFWKTSHDMRYLHPQPTPVPANCLELARKDNNVACIYPSIVITKDAVNQDLHISRETLFQQNYYFFSRKHWPLNNKVKLSSMRWFDTGLIDYYSKTYIRSAKKKKEKIERIQRREAISYIEFEDLTYFYGFFAFIQIVGILLFAVEHLVAYYRRR